MPGRGTIMRLPRPLPVYDVNSDRYPDDDKYIEQWKITMLNRIDQEWGCDFIIGTTYTMFHNVVEYCGLPEHDPFTDRCWSHARQLDVRT